MDNLSPDTAAALLNASQANTDNKLRSLKSSTTIQDLESIEAVAKEFEAVFLSEMLKPMFEGISSEPPFGGGKTEEVFKGFMLQEYGKLIAETGQIGIADAVKAEMIKMQEAVDGNTDNS